MTAALIEAPTWDTSRSEARSRAAFERRHKVPYRPRRITAADEQLAKVIDLAERRERRGLPRWGINSPVRWSPAVRDQRPAWWRAPTGTETGWHTREHYLQHILPLVLGDHPEVLAAHHVAPETFLRWARIESMYAQDQRTGRRVIVRPDTVGRLMGCMGKHPKRTAQRCRAAARDLGVLVDVKPGRMLTAEESKAARKAGSPQRGLATESRFVVPVAYEHTATAAPVRRPKATTRRRSRRPHPVGHVTPTSGTGSLREPSVPTGLRSFEKQRKATGNGPAQAPDPAPTKKMTPALRLALDLRRRVVWLQSTPARRIAPQLAKFARQAHPWTADDIVAVLDGINRRLDYSAPNRPHTAGYGLLAWYLGQISAEVDHLPERERRQWNKPWCGRCDADHHRYVLVLEDSGRTHAQHCPRCNPQALRRQHLATVEDPA